MALDITKEIEFRGFKYFPKSGRLHRNHDVRGLGRDGAVGWKNNLGYMVFGHKGKDHLIHRAAYSIMTKAAIPARLVVDHIDGNPSNNKFSNLRLTTQRRNCQNMRRHREGRRVGGYFNKPSGKYISQIRINGRLKHLGHFKTMDEACDRYDREVASLEATE